MKKNIVLLGALTSLSSFAWTAQENPYPHLNKLKNSQIPKICNQHFSQNNKIKDICDALEESYALHYLKESLTKGYNELEKKYTPEERKQKLQSHKWKTLRARFFEGLQSPSKLSDLYIKSVNVLFPDMSDKDKKKEFFRMMKLALEVHKEEFDAFEAKVLNAK